MTSSDQCFCLPFYSWLRRATRYRGLSQRAPERCKYAAGLGLRRGARARPRGHRGCTIRASTGVSDLHSPQRDKNPPAADGARRAGGLPRRQGVFGGGESERAGARMKAGGGADTCPPTPRPRRRLLLHRGRTPAAGQPHARPGGGLGPAAAGGFVPLLSQEPAEPRGGAGVGRTPRGAAQAAAGPVEAEGSARGRGACGGGDAGRARQARPQALLRERSRAEAAAARPPHSPLSISLPFLAVAAFPMAGPGRGAGGMPGGGRAGLGWRGGAARGRGGGSGGGAALAPLWVSVSPAAAEEEASALPPPPPRTRRK